MKHDTLINHRNNEKDNKFNINHILALHYICCCGYVKITDMSRYDNAPVKNTCPTIDNIIGKMETAKGEAEWMAKNPEEESTDEANNIIGELSDAISDMECIRSDNSKLRDWGNEQHDRADSAEEERDEAIRAKEYADEEITELKARIEELENQLSEVECA